MKILATCFGEYTRCAHCNLRFYISGTAVRSREGSIYHQWCWVIADLDHEKDPEMAQVLLSPWGGMR